MGESERESGAKSGKNAKRQKKRNIHEPPIPVSQWDRSFSWWRRHGLKWPVKWPSYPMGHSARRKPLLRKHTQFPTLSLFLSFILYIPDDTHLLLFPKLAMFLCFLTLPSPPFRMYCQTALPLRDVSFKCPFQWFAEREKALFIVIFWWSQFSSFIIKYRV